MAFCSNCGQKLNENAKFCHECGYVVGTSEKNREDYVGQVLKCPSCGEAVSEMTAICPICGIHIARKDAVNSVQIFKEQLMDIENKRKTSSIAVITGMFKADDADIQKLTLIQNFPIPNSIDDITEFMLLAIANIDVGLSKTTALNRWYGVKPSGETGATIARSISNAWVKKMEQLYHKAEAVFKSEPEFQNIKTIYFEKMKELKIKIK